MNGPLSRRAILLAIAFALLVTLSANAPLVQSAGTYGGATQDLVRTWEIVRTSIARGEGFPLWDRYQCGGIPLFASPNFGLLSAIVVAVTGMHGDVMGRLYPIALTFLAVLGGFLWAVRGLRLRMGGALLCGAAFAVSGALATHIFYRPEVAAFAFLPWALAALRTRRPQVVRGMIAGVWLAAMALEGGLWSAEIGLLVVLAVEGATSVMNPEPRSGWSWLALFAVMLSLSAVRLVPAIVLWARSDAAAGDEVLRLTQLIPMLVDRDRQSAVLGMTHPWPDYRLYVGPLLAGAAIAGTGTAVVLAPRRWGALLLIVLGLALLVGPASPVAPGSWLARLPGLTSYGRFGARYAPVFALGIAAAAAIAYDEASRRVRSVMGRIAIAAAGALAVADPTFAASSYLTTQLTHGVLAHQDAPPHAFYVVEARGIAPVEAPARGVGLAACSQDWGYKPSPAIAIGDKQQADIGGRPEQVKVVAASANRIELSLRNGGVVRLNQTYDPDWSADVGETRMAMGGLLDVVTPTGAQRVVVRYRPAGLIAGATVSALGILGGLSLAVWAWRKRRLTAPPTPASNA